MPAITGLDVTSPAADTVRIAGTANSVTDRIDYLIQAAPGSIPSSLTTPTGSEAVTPGQPFQIDVPGQSGEVRVWARAVETA